MGDFGSWAQGNWFPLLQSLGIVGSLWFTAFASHQDRKSRKTSDLLALANHHRELWSDAHRRKELSRIFISEVDLVAKPVSFEEEEFLNVVIVHFHTGWMLSKEGIGAALPVISLDIRSFFSLPIPRLVWSKTKSSRDPEFVRFVEKSIGS